MPGFDKFSPRRFPVIFAFLISGAVILALESPGNEEWNSPGGHRDLHHAAVTCESCHQPAPGTLKDKIQSNFQYWLGRREQGAAFFKKQVHSSDCLDCHRNIDQHAGFLFQEETYREVRESLSPQNCASCHANHSGKIINQSQEFCSHCHQDLNVSEDSIQPTHKTLITGKRWNTCLQCHDYHGNHLHTAPQKLEDAISFESIQEYLNDASVVSPYGEIKTPYLKKRGAPR